MGTLFFPLENPKTPYYNTLYIGYYFILMKGGNTLYGEN